MRLGIDLANQLSRGSRPGFGAGGTVGGLLAGPNFKTPSE